MRIEKVVIIIPTYNEALVIEDTLLALFQTIASIVSHEVQVLVFDSCSTDDTAARVRAMQDTNDRLYLQTEPSKSGLGSAYLQAMRFALEEMSADLVVEFDADLSHQPHYIPLMLEKMKTHDVVVGSRYVIGGSIPKAWGWHRKLLSVLGNKVARWFLTSKYKDFTSGFRMTHRRVLETVLPTAFLSNHYAYKIELMWLLHRKKARIAEYPIVFVDREKGVSKLPTNSILDSLRVLSVLRFNALQGYLKMCLVGLSGVLVQCVLYNVLRQTMPPIQAAQCAIFAAIVNNFLLNNRFTFKTAMTRAQCFKSLGLFIGYSLMMVGAQSYWLHLGLKYLGQGGLQENITLLSGIILGSLLNYLIYSRLIWRQNPTISSAAPLDNNTV